MVDHGQRKEGNNDPVYHTHTLNNDQGQPLNAMWRYTLSCAPKHTRYYCADKGFEKAPSPNTLAMPPKQMSKEQGRPFSTGHDPYSYSTGASFACG